MALSSSVRFLGESVARPGRSVPWLAAATLVVAEYVCISYSFNIAHLGDRGGWLAAIGLLGHVGPTLALAVPATILLLRHAFPARLAHSLELASSSLAIPRRVTRWPSLVIHVFGFATFFWLTRYVVGESEEATGPGVLLVAAWAGAGLGAGVGLVQLVVPLRVFGGLTRRLAAPLALGIAIGCIAWTAGRATEQLWQPLSAGTLVASSGILRLLTTDSWTDPLNWTLGAGGFEVVIGPPCSGYDGMGLMLILTGAYLWIVRSEFRFPRVLALLPIAVGLAWFANVIRIVALMLIGVRWSPEVALGGFHLKAGWLLFCGVALALVTWTQRSPWFSKSAQRGREVEANVPNPTAAYLAPLLTIVAVGMMTGLFATGLDVLYPLGVLASAAVLWHFHLEYPRVALPWSWTTFGIGVAAFGIWMLLEPAPDAVALSAWRQELVALGPVLTLLWLGSRVVGSVVIVPLVEELAFRGYLLRRFFSADFTSVSLARFGWLSFLGSSLAYGLVHQRWLAGCLAGMLFALAQYRRGRLSDAILAHAVANLLIALAALGWGRWSLWM